MKDGVYEESDYVEVVDAGGTVQENKIPKQWIGTWLAPDVKQATKAQVKKAESDGSTDEPGS